MARGSLLPLVALAGLGGVVLVESNAHGGFGAWLHQLGGGLAGTVGATSSAVGTTAQQTIGLPSATAVNPSASASGIGGSGVYAGNPAAITAAAHAAGVYDASSGASGVYGAALWSLQSGQPQSAFGMQPPSVQATFASVATKGS